MWSYKTCINTLYLCLNKPPDFPWEMRFTWQHMYQYIYHIYIYYLYLVYIKIYKRLNELLLYQTDLAPIDLEPCTDSFGTLNGRIRLLFQINLKMVNTIWIGFDLLRFGKKFSVCIINVGWNIPPSERRSVLGIMEA